MGTNWDERYMGLAEQVSTWSKDPSAKIGAVAIGEQGQVLAQGYNGFPRGVLDHEERYLNKEEKYKFVVHAEMNTIYNASYNGISLRGSTLYVYGLPICNECAKGIIQTGVSRVVMRYTKQPEKWMESFEITKKMFDEANIKYEIISDRD